MPQFVAIETDRSGFRAAVVEERAAGLAVTNVVNVADDKLDSVAALAEAVRSALPDVRWSRAKLVGVVGGDQLRCRLLKLPPCPESELPDLVRLQAAREFSSTESNDVVDYVPVAGDESNPRTVLAASADADDLARLRELAAALDTPLERVTPRGSSVASLALKLFPELTHGSHLIVAAAEDAADLVAVDGGVTSLLRSTRIARDAEPSTLAAEARRTSAMAAQQLGRRMAATTYIGFSAPPSRSEASTLNLPLRLTQEYGMSVDQAEVAARLTGVVGAALERAAESRPSIDFINPRQPVRDVSQQKRQVVLAVAAVASLLLGMLYAYSRLWSLEGQVDSAKQLLRSEEQRLEDFAPIRNKAGAIEEWLSTDVNWLDEFERLGRKLRPKTLDDREFPADQDVYLKQFTAARATQRNAIGGRIDFRALSRSPFSYDEIEQALRDDRHEVETASGNAAPEGGKYNWETQTALRVAPSEGEGGP